MSMEESQKLRIVVLGATGPSGTQLVEEALEQGHHVTALVRSPEKITQKHENLKAIKVDVYDEETMVGHMRGQDAIISCLGCAPSWFNRREITFYKDTIKVICRAMKKAGITRLIVMSSWYSKYNGSDPFILNWLLKPLMLGNILHSMGAMEDYLADGDENIEFTSVRCPQMINKNKTGKTMVVTEGQYALGASYFISRRDVVVFLVEEAIRGLYKRKCIAIGTQ